MTSEAKKIHSIIFWKNEPVSIKDLVKISNIEEKEVKKLLEEIKDCIKDTGVVLMQNDNEVMLGTSPDTSDFISNFKKNELSKELSKATLETLSIILYKGPVKRSEIDFIRGVNSQFILRHLETRGLITKSESKDDGRAFVYDASLELLSFLGVTEKKDLPKFTELKTDLEASIENKINTEENV